MTNDHWSQAGLHKKIPKNHHRIITPLCGEFYSGMLLFYCAYKLSIRTDDLSIKIDFWQIIKHRCNADGICSATKSMAFSGPFTEGVHSCNFTDPQQNVFQMYRINIKCQHVAMGEQLHSFQQDLLRYHVHTIHRLCFTRNPYENKFTFNICLSFGPTFLYSFFLTLTQQKAGLTFLVVYKAWQSVKLTHCGLATPYGIGHFG